MTHASRASVLSLAAWLLGMGLGAQVAPCPYDRCALWLPRGDGTHVAMGVDTTPVATGSMVPSVNLLADADPVTKRWYSLARRQYSRSAVVGFVGIATFVGTIVYYGTGERDWRTPAGIGLPASMLATWVGGAAFGIRAEDHMRAAIWSYNVDLLDEHDTEASTCPYRRCAIRIKGSRIVRGADGVLVGRVTSRAVADLLSTAPDSGVRASFQSYLASRRANRTAGLIVLGSLLAGGIVLAAGEGETAEAVGGVLIYVGYGVGHLNMSGPAREASYLEQAIWRYNRQFAEHD